MFSCVKELSRNLLPRRSAVQYVYMYVHGHLDPITYQGTVQYTVYWYILYSEAELSEFLTSVS